MSAGRRALRIVIVDDIATLRKLIRLLIAGAGHEVVAEAADGRAGVAVALEHAPEVVIMDWQMPELDGVQATRQILARAPSISVIAFSSASDPHVRDEFMTAGAAAYVDKGDVSGLLSAIARITAPTGP
jgi:DNA-binding NarL/FixJ family response regulator